MATQKENPNQATPLGIRPEIAKRLIKRIFNSEDPDNARSLAEMLAYLYVLAQRTASSQLENQLHDLGKEAFDHAQASYDAFEEFAAQSFESMAEYAEPQAPDSSPEEASGAESSTGPASDNERSRDTRSRDTRRENVMSLGEHLAAILDNPETPSEIYNDLVDSIADL